MSSVSVPTAETPAVAPAPEENSATRPDHVPEKFWDAEKGEVNVEAMAKSYTELESKRFKADGEDKADENQKPDEGEGEGVENFINEALTKVGIDRDALTQEITDNGKLSDESYTNLEKAGFSKAEVDQYLRGGQATTAEADALAEADVAEIHTFAGGKEAVDSMLQWAAENMSEDQVGAYNQMIDSGNKQQAMAGMSYLKSLYEAAEGKEPSLLSGNPTGEDLSVFRSELEVTKAMRDPRYGKDTAYTEDVMQKVGRSKVFGR